MEKTLETIDTQCAQKGMSRQAREELLQGPTVKLVVSYSGTSMEHDYQLQASKGKVSRDRIRQLDEQMKQLIYDNAEGRESKIFIDFPIRALEAATSITLSDSLITTSQTPELRVDLGPILPGYLMEVLDWYCRSLRNREWKDFLPDELSFEGLDKFFYLYIYITMRAFELHKFADHLGVALIRYLIQQHQLIDEARTLDFLLQHLSTYDMIFEPIAEHYISLIKSNQCSLFPEQWDTICQHYPHFAELLEKYQGLCNKSDEAVQQTEKFLQILDVGENFATDEG